MNNTAILIDDDVDDPTWQRWINNGFFEKGVRTLLTMLNVTPLMTAPLCIRFASNHSVQQLNSDWRDKDAVTDVLSFPMQDGPYFVSTQPLGDIVLAVPFIHEAAKSLHIPVEHHAMHLIIHGLLHLLAHDHQDGTKAAIMESLESECLQQLGLHNPYSTNV